MTALLPPPAIAQLAIRTTSGALLTYLIAVGLGLPQADGGGDHRPRGHAGECRGHHRRRHRPDGGHPGRGRVGAVVAVVQPSLGLPDYLALVLAVAPLAAMAAIRPRLRIAPLTAVIILLAAPADVGTLAALERILEIALGTGVGLAASLLIFPALHLPAPPRCEALRLLGWLVHAHLMGATAHGDEGAIVERLAKMRGAIAAAEASGAEVTRERASHVSDVDDPLPILRSLRRVRSDVALLSRATSLPLPSRWPGAWRQRSRAWLPPCGRPWIRSRPA